MINEKAKQRKIEKIQAVKEENEREDLIHRYNICPDCGEDLQKIIFPSPKNTFFKKYVDGYELTCRTHRVLFTIPARQEQQADLGC